MAFVGRDGQKIERKYLELWVDVSEAGSSTPEWELQGRGIEESAIELNTEVNKVKDILGFVDTSIDGMQPQQSFDPNSLRVGRKLDEKLHELYRTRDLAGFTGFNVLTVYRYILGTEEGTFEADMETNCTLEVSSLGGSAYMDMPFVLHNSNEITRGTVTYVDGKPVFTASTGIVKDDEL